MDIRNTISSVLLVLVIAGGILIYQNDQEIRDWWFLRSYQPTPEISALATEAGFNDNGRQIFYVSNPEINNKQEFNDNCPFEERTIVLGCYDGYQIFVLGIDDERLEGVETVTSAHEMLHAAYARLDSSEKARINKLLNEEFSNTDNQRIIELVSGYDTSDTELINNELHSILPTELTDLSPELEQYYSQYFADRQKTVAAAKQYEAIFVQLSDEIDSLHAQIDAYKQEIESKKTQIESLSSQIQTERTELDRLRNDDVEQYNSRVPGFNGLVDQYNSLVGQLDDLVAQHNSLVAEANDKALQQNSLIHSIDSNYQEI